MCFPELNYFFGKLIGKHMLILLIQ